MPRTPSPKTIRSTPATRVFTPLEGEPTTVQGGIILLLEEWEALRLVDYAGLEQTEAAISMGISRQSVQMLLSSARSKLARVVVEGLPLRIQGDPKQTGKSDTSLIKRNSRMKIAVTAQNTQVFPHFGRTPEFYIVTAEDGKITDENIIQAPAEGHGALVSFLVSQDVDTLICGGIGGGAVNSLRAAGISREEVFRFSFLLSIPAILGAALIQVRETGGVDEFLTSLPQGWYLGAAAAFISGLASLFVLKKLVIASKWWLFGIDCLIIGSLSIFISFLGVW